MTETSALMPGKRIVRAQEAEHWVDGHAFLAQAREQAAQIVERGTQQALEARDAAVAEGLAQGQAAASQLLLETSSAVDRYLATVETQLAELSLALVRQVLDDLDATALIAQLCQRALRDFRDEQRLTLHVPVAQVEPVTALLHAQLGMLRVHGDASLGPRHATLSSPVAAVDLDVDEQLHGLRLALGLPDAVAPVGPGR